jgi:hypothetical protein
MYTRFTGRESHRFSPAGGRGGGGGGGGRDDTAVRGREKLYPSSPEEAKAEFWKFQKFADRGKHITGV